MAMANARRDRMTQQHLNVWRNNRERLIDDLCESMPIVTSHLFADGIIRHEDQQRIVRILRDFIRPDPKLDAARELTITLEGCGLFVLPDVITSLRNIGFIGLCDQLEKSMHDEFRQEDVQQGKMKPEHEKIWNRRTPDLIENFSYHLNPLTDRLVSSNIISRIDEERIRNVDRRLQLEDPRAGASELVDILLMRGENVLQRMIPILNDMGFANLARELYEEVDKTNLMNPGDLRIWKNNSDYLVTKMEMDLPRFLRIFLEAGIINEADRTNVEELERNGAPPEGTRQLIELLTNRGENILDRIKTALINGGYKDIVETLERSVLENLPNVPSEETSAQLPE